MGTTIERNSSTNLNGALDPPTDIEEVPAGSAGDVAGLNAAQGSKGQDTAVQHRQSVRRRNIAPGDAVRGTSDTAQMAHDAQQIAGKAIPYLRRGAGGPAEIGIKAVAALFFKDQRQYLLFQVSLLVEMPLRIIFCQPRIGRFQALVQLHQR